MGNYKVQLVPSEHSINLLSVRDIVVKGGHAVLFTPTSAIIRDVGGNYEVRFEKLISEDDWFAPTNTLNILSQLRNKHPLNLETLQLIEHGGVNFETVRLKINRTPNPQQVHRRRSHAYSGRLRNTDPTLRGRVFNAHHIMGHMCQDCMYRAVTPRTPGGLPYWRNIGVTGPEINHVFYNEPCLLCVLAKRRKEGTRKLLTKIQQQPGSTIEIKPDPDEETEKMYRKQLAEDAKLRPGEIVSCDDVPVSPISLDGFDTFFIFRDTKTRTLFTFTTKGKGEDTYLSCLTDVRVYFVQKYRMNPSWGVQPVMTIRSDFMKTYKSKKVKEFYEDNDCTCEFSSPYQHWQNAVERDVQTVVHNMIAVLHTNEFITAAMWSFALRHFTRLFNDTPLSSAGYLSPNQMCDPDHYVDASVSYRFAFGDLLVYPLEKHERKGKLDVKNDVGFYFGDHPQTKDSVWLYLPYYHHMLPRAGVQRLNVSELQLLRWYGKRVDVRKPTLTFGEYRKGLLQLVPFTFQEEVGAQPHYAPKIVEGSDDEQYSSDDPDAGDTTDDEEAKEDERRTDEPTSSSPIEHTVAQAVKNTVPPRRGKRGKRHRRRKKDRITFPIETLPLEPLQTRGQRGLGKSVDYRALNNGVVLLKDRDDEDGPPRVRLMSYRTPNYIADYTDAVAIDIALSKLDIDDNHMMHELESTILHTFRAMQTSDPDINNNVNTDAPVDEFIDSIEAHQAIKIDEKSGNTLFRDAIRSEVLDNLIKNTGTLKPISQEQLQQLKDYIMIPTTVKCKRKLKPDGSYDKHKARTAARGDLLVRKLIKLGMDLPDTFSPTIRTLTFLLVLQIAIAKGLKCATQDIKYAYLNADIPESDVPIITKLHPLVAEMCGLDPKQLYQIMKCLYGLPKSGKLWYEHYTRNLIKEGYKQSSYDPCLFYRINEHEITYICLFVDDTFVFSNSDENLNLFLQSMQKHYQVSLDTTAESFLGIHFDHLQDGSILMSQPKLLQKVLNEYPKLDGYKSKKHPYGPQPSAGYEDHYAKAPPIEQGKYLRLLGLLLYLTKSRPDIMTAVSFGATKSHAPNAMDYRKLLYIVEYLRITPAKGHRIYSNNDQPIQLHCTVDASYLLHPDSKGHTGYTIGFYNEGTFYNRSAKQSLVSTSSTHAEMRAIFTLVKDILYVLYICSELQLQLTLPAIIMEDNSAVITVTTDESAYAKKCKHFLMLINYVREQVDLGIIKILKIPGQNNMSDVLTKPNFNEKDFENKTDGLLGKRPFDT